MRLRLMSAQWKEDKARMGAADEVKADEQEVAVQELPIEASKQIKAIFLKSLQLFFFLFQVLVFQLTTLYLLNLSFIFPATLLFEILVKILTKICVEPVDWLVKHFP